MEMFNEQPDDNPIILATQLLFASQHMWKFNLIEDALECLSEDQLKSQLNTESKKLAF